MNFLTTASQSYMDTFTSYIHTFLQWGQILFVSLLTINIIWMALWYAFDSQSFSDSMPSFLKKFSVIAIFYSLMLHPEWLGSLLKSVEVIGVTLTHQQTDPSSIIAQGLGLANKIIEPVKSSSLLTAGFSLIIVAIAYLIVLSAFISIALDLAVTLIVTTALISLSTFFLSFAALGATTQIARQTLDVILANCLKIFGIYVVVAAGSSTIVSVSNQIPTQFESFDPYAWIIAVALLFGILAKTLPNQLAKLVSGSFQETTGTSGAAIVLSAINLAKTAQQTLNVAGTAAAGIAKIVGSTAFNAAAHFSNNKANTGCVMQGLVAASKGAATDLAKLAGGSLADRFKNTANKLSGGPGNQTGIRSVAERMHQRAKDTQPRKST